MGNGPDASKLPQGCTADRADVVLLHFGTNDVWGTQPTQKTLDAYSQVVDARRSANPSVIVFVAQILRMNPSSCAACQARVEDLNAAIPVWAAQTGTSVSPIYPVAL